MKKEIICTICPRGCRVIVEGDAGAVAAATGYACKRGLVFASDEFTHPVRILTTSVRLTGAKRELLPVRSAKPLPREKLLDCMAAIRRLTVAPPIEQYDVVLSNICDTGVDMVATRREA